MSQLLEKRHQFDWLTCYGVATQFKLTYYLENCTKFADGKLYDWQDVSLLSFLSCMNKDTIDDSKIREIARNEPWQSIWRTSNKDSTVFNRTPLELTEDQKKLILWTAFYDNIHENQDCPSKQIIDDDDALDGWLILQHQKQGKETKEDPIASKLTNPKIANANEIFILADNEEEAKKIDELNDANSKRIKRERVAVTMARGEVQEYEMPDNQLHLRTMATKAYSDFIKRK